MKKKIGSQLLCLLVIVIYLIPFYILTTVALKSPAEATSKWAWPQTLCFDNFYQAWTRAHLGRAIFNNILITGISVTLVVLIAAAAAYPLARFKTKLNHTVYNIIIACMVVPALTILVPLYKFIVDMGGINSYWAIILVQVTFALPLATFLFTGFINSVPRELDEAALIDGCNRFQIFYMIILPLLKPVTATVVILTGVSIWNDYQFSIFFLQKTEVKTIPVALAQFFSQFQNDLSFVAAGCMIGMLPLALLYLALQKYFIKGISDGAVKG